MSEPRAGRAWTYGDDVDTDRLFPGRYTYTLREPTEIAAHALEDLDPRFAREARPGDVVVGGRNFGCGSSREQAVTALTANGVAAVIAVSFGRIFYRNAINLGLPAIVCPSAAAAIALGDPVTIDLEAHTIRSAGGVFAFSPYSDTIRSILEVGGLIPFVRHRLHGDRSPARAEPTVPETPSDKETHDVR